MNTAKIILGALLLVFSLSFAVNVTTCGVIDTPGDYNVLNDLTTATGDCLVIQADNVNLYGNAHSISATSGTSYAIYVTEGSDNVLVDRALLENSMTGLRAGGDGPDPGSLWDPVNGLTLRGNIARYNSWGFELIGVTNSLLDGNTAFENAGHGFYITESNGNELVANTAEQNSEYGLYLTHSSSNTLRSNTASGNGDEGFVLVGDSDNNVLESNTATGNLGDYGGFALIGFFSGSTPIFPEGNSLSGNTAEQNYRSGFYLVRSPGTVLFGNTAEGNGEPGILAVASPDTQVIGNTVSGNTGNSPLTLAQIFISSSGNAYIYDNTVSGPGNGIKVAGSPNSAVMGNEIANTDIAIILASEDTSVAQNTVENSAVAFQSSDLSSGNQVTDLLMRSGTQELRVSFSYTHPRSQGFTIGLASAPDSPPSGYVSFNSKYFTINPTSTLDLYLYIDWANSELGSLNESSIGAFRYDGAWTELPAGRDVDGHKLYLKNFDAYGSFGLFGIVPPTPPTPPTPPSGGGSSGGGSSGGSGRAGSGGAVHVGVPFVPSGTTSGGEEATPSCTSDSNCGSNEECSSGRCTALEAESSCGTFQDHAWVDLECCDTSDCGAGEVCRDNACTSMEPLVITASERTSTEASNEGIGRLLADVPWWVLALLLLMVGGGIYARYAMGREPPEEGSEEELPPAGEEEE